jgi:gluconolactonase
MKKIISLFIITSLLSGHVCSSQNAEIISINSSFSKIVDKDARIEKISDGFQFLEGPVWHKDGYLLFSDIPANKIYRYTHRAKVSVFTSKTVGM